MNDRLLEETWRTLLVASGAVGACIGSFLNVVAWRLPLGRSVVSPPSACPRCGRGIRPWHNIPVVGWLLLRGRCFDCRLSIPVRYPLVELAVALLWAALFYRLAPTPEALLSGRSWWLLPALGFYFSTLVAITLIDAAHRIIPPALSWPLIPLGVVVAVASDLWGLGHPGLPESVAGALLGGAGTGLLAWFGRWVFRRDALGEGDVHLLAAIGAWQGAWPTLPMTLFLASLAGSVVGISVIARRGRDRPPHLPFGPMLCGAALAVFLWPDLAERLWPLK